MADNITRRDWLAGTTAIAGSVILSKTAASAQTVSLLNVNPTQENPLRMGFNENPYGQSEKARKAMIDAMDKSHQYNFFAIRQLFEVMVKQSGLPFENISFAAGSGQFLERLTYLNHIDGGAILTPTPTYGDVVRVGRALGSKIIEVPVGEDMAINLEAMRQAMTDEVKLIYICNPNNPIPTIVEKNALKEFCIEMSKKAVVLIDEAYYEYAGSPDYATMADLVTEHKNIVVLRTASKIHGFAGVRIGYAFSDPDMVKRMGNGFPINMAMNYMAIRGAIESFQDTDYQNYVVQKNNEALDILYKMFDELDLPYIKSNANFTFFNAGRPSKEIENRMRELHIITGREFKPFTNWVRISTAKPEEVEYFTQVYKREFG